MCACPTRSKVLLDSNERLSNRDRLPYLRSTYWRRRSDHLHWGAFDLKAFYPNNKQHAVLKGFLEFEDSLGELVTKLAPSLLRFPLETSGWSDEDLEKLGIPTGSDVFPGVPTGLVADGFLANVAMLPVDRKVEERARPRQVAHFRYVDDHCVLARSPRFTNDLDQGLRPDPRRVWDRGSHSTTKRQTRQRSVPMCSERGIARQRHAPPSRPN